ncbi:hypothetical protein CFC21_033814 [Triticum aestivum]|uniref:Uncharacterized protein n=2 Tax=Triticum aestivum TaxID=4565 RepID=A0A9R1F2B7_WHEAT|nr:hypothetical protein CFC21_033814 [Triticum aestivum]
MDELRRHSILLCAPTDAPTSPCCSCLPLPCSCALCSTTNTSSTAPMVNCSLSATNDMSGPAPARTRDVGLIPQRLTDQVSRKAPLDGDVQPLQCQPCLRVDLIVDGDPKLGRALATGEGIKTESHDVEAQVVPDIDIDEVPKLVSALLEWPASSLG